jgi:glutamate decarboxylase
VSWKLQDGAQVPFSLYDLADRLRVRGWQVPAYSMPPDREDLVVQRILVRNGVTRDLVTSLLEDFRRALEYFEKHPASSPLTAAEGTGYHH